LRCKISRSSRASASARSRRLMAERDSNSARGSGAFKRKTTTSQRRRVPRSPAGMTSAASSAGAACRAASRSTLRTRTRSTARGALRLPTVKPNRNVGVSPVDSVATSARYRPPIRNCSSCVDGFCAAAKSAGFSRRRERGNTKPRVTAPRASNSQPLAAPGAPRAQHRTPAARLHSNEKAVRALALDHGRLIGTFGCHADVPRGRRAGAVDRDDPAVDVSRNGAQKSRVLEATSAGRVKRRVPWLVGLQSCAPDLHSLSKRTEKFLRIYCEHFQVVSARCLFSLDS